MAKKVPRNLKVAASRSRGRQTPRTPSKRCFPWAKREGVLLTSAYGFLRLNDLAHRRQLMWLQWQLFASSMAQTILSTERELRAFLAVLLVDAASRGSLDGIESLLLSCLQVAQLNGNRSLVTTTLEVLRANTAKRYKSASPPIAFYDTRTKVLTLTSAELWPELVDRLLKHRFLTRGARVGQILRAEVALSSAAGRIKPETGLWSQLNGIDRVLIALGAASDCLVPGRIVDDPYGRAPGSTVPGTPVEEPDQSIKGDNNDSGFRYSCWLRGGRLTGPDGSQEEDEPEMPVSDDDRTLDEVLGEPDPPLSESEIDIMTGPTPPPDDGQTLDEVLGEPDPPLTPEEIDDLTSTTPRPDDDGTGGPTRGPIGPTATPRPDDLGTDNSGRGPIGPAFLKVSYAGQRYFPSAGSYFLPTTGYALQRGIRFRAEFLGSNVGGHPVLTTFLIFKLETGGFSK